MSLRTQSVKPLATPHDIERLAAAQAKRDRRLECLLNTPEAKARKAQMDIEHDAGTPMVFPEPPEDSPEF
jgi:hypothetical protein